MQTRDRHFADDFCTVAEAAATLGVSASTVWRWVDSGKLPAFRVGPKSIRIKRQDVEAAIRPNETDFARRKRIRIYTDIKDIPPKTEENRRRALAWLDEAEKHAREITARRGRVPLPDSTEIIREAREERSRQL